MVRYAPLVVALDAVSARAEKPASAIVHDSADARVLVFRIEPGQQVSEHSNASTVMLSVLEGPGEVVGAQGRMTVQAGDLVIYAPNEMHSMRALEGRFVVQATIAPRPGGR